MTEIIAECQRCGGKGTGKTFQEASRDIDHAIGMIRGIPCDSNYNRIVEVKTETQQKEITNEPTEKPKVKKQKSSNF